MRFYTHQHQFYCGIDLHARAMYVCIMDQTGTVLVHKNLPSQAESFLQIIAPYQNDIVVAVECVFTWYWIAAMLWGGMLPMAYTYPQKMRSTRDLLRRRMYLMHQRSELLAHIQNSKEYRCGCAASGYLRKSSLKH
ncbi:hypothetical protein ES705_25653 [subsurface metagenome]